MSSCLWGLSYPLISLHTRDASRQARPRLSPHGGSADRLTGRGPEISVLPMEPPGCSPGLQAPVPVEGSDFSPGGSPWGGGGGSGEPGGTKGLCAEWQCWRDGSLPPAVILHSWPVELDLSRASPFEGLAKSLSVPSSRMSPPPGARFCSSASSIPCRSYSTSSRFWGPPELRGSAGFYGSSRSGGTSDFCGSSGAGGSFRSSSTGSAS